MSLVEGATAGIISVAINKYQDHDDQYLKAGIIGAGSQWLASMASNKMGMGPVVKVLGTAGLYTIAQMCCEDHYESTTKEMIRGAIIGGGAHVAGAIVGTGEGWMSNMLDGRSIGQYLSP